MGHLARALVAASCLLAFHAGAWAQDAKSDSKGWFVASLSQDSGITSAGLVVRSFADPDFKREVNFNLGNMFESNQQEWEERKGVVRVVQVPAGTYRIANFRLAHSASNQKWSAREDFSVAFDVRANEVTYLGEFNGTGILGKAFLGFRAIEKPYFFVSDQQARDMPIAVKEKPELAGIAVRSIAPMRSTKGANYFLTRRIANPPP